MGNRAIITTENRELGVYLHWNGGRDSVEGFLEYCRLKGYRNPEDDGYGYARLCQVIGNFFGSGLSVGVMPWINDVSMCPGDNGIYVIRGWRIVDRLISKYDDYSRERVIEPFRNEWEQREYDLLGMLLAIDERMPEDERLGEYLTAKEVNTSDLKVGDVVYMPSNYEGGTYQRYTVQGFADIWNYKNAPYVDRFGHSKTYSDNINNYIMTPTIRIAGGNDDRHN